ncbi:hypothetical protein FQA39_LY19257 [Lamprigera yunnana]|nr:hypothetical protein FQA39_LY19257 [Lamprigera yunnana]
MCNVTRYRRDWDPCSFAKGHVKRSHNEEGGHSNIRVGEIHLFSQNSFRYRGAYREERTMVHRTAEMRPFKEDLCLVTEAYNAETLALLCIRQLQRNWKTKPIYFVCGKPPKDGLTIRCQGEQYKLNIDPNLGALLIDVPCHCQFEDGDSTDVYPTFPCVDKTIKFGLQTVLPAIWTKTPGLTLPSWDKTMPQFDNLDDCLNEKWININSENQAIPTITYYVIANFILITLNIPDENEYLDPNEINPQHETPRVPPNLPSRSRPTQFESSATSDTKTI